MQYFVRLFTVACCVLGGFHSVPAVAEKRVALVIGNAQYQHSRFLLNPRNDAEAIAKLLRDIGFEEIALKINVDYRAMREAVRAFGQAAGEADVALIYYAGHGLEVAGENYLVPTDAKLVRGADLEYEAVTLVSLLNAAGNARRLRVVILDACRNNPLGERIALKAGTTRSVTRGLARIEPTGDVLVAYSAKAGTLAEDGKGKHSPYAEALLEHMATPGLDVRLMFGKVRDSVISATRQRQEPYTYGSLSGDVVPLVPGRPLTKTQEIELLFWASVKDSTSPAVLSTYLDRYPDGEFAPIARALIEHYERQLKLELAKREEERKLREAALKAAEAKRLEEERRIREAALAEERRRAQEAKDAEAAKRLAEKQKTDALAIAESVQKALAEEAAAREAAELAEKNRLAALKDAEGAAKAAEEAISRKRDAENSPAKLAALPRIEKPAAIPSFDGTWRVEFSWNEHCTRRSPYGGVARWTIKQGVLTGRTTDGRTVRGTVAPDGRLRVRWLNPFSPKMQTISARLSGNAGVGTWSAAQDSRCGGLVRFSRT